MKKTYYIRTIKIDATDKEILNAFEDVYKAFIEIVPHEDIIKIYVANNPFMLHAFLAEDICENDNMEWKKKNFYSAEDFLLQRKQFIKLDNEYCHIFLCIGIDKQIERLAYKIAKILKCYVSQIFKIK